MKTEKIAVYSLTFVLFSLMMLVYWLPKTTTWSPAYSRVIETLLLFLLARTGGNIALVIFDNKMTASIPAGIMAMIMFPLLLIRSEALFIFTLMLWAPVTTFLISYSLFKNRSRFPLMNFVKILAAGISACAFYLSVIFMILKNNPDMSRGGEYAELFWFALGIVIACIEIIVMIIVLIKEYTLQKDEAQKELKDKQ
ncbi:MAG: hypothetical protein KJ808_05935 [Acidobacteria bacterium]|nr:hypothetical protein [Acidobacteriota bacterium]MBU4307053.1 hypothetical protein [Acidobacteriota bacterium]MBU4405793.1 hypothetical protein [Acidobacteriota bacterium]MCG2810258.1 hypothetical protein [Candidatus Aminicenantes bacterium]